MRIERIDVTPNVVHAVVRFSAEEPLRSSAYPDLPRRLLRALPGLARHACTNDVGRPFVVEIADTEIAHLVEHVALEIMALAGSPRRAQAHTTWDFERDGRGVFHVEIAYDNDLVCLGALKLAEQLVRGSAEGCVAPDVDGEIGRLRALRGG